MEDIIAIVLAAGLGTRMNSNGQKVLTHLLGKPMLLYVISKLRKLNLSKIFVVVGHQKEEVNKKLEGEGVEFVEQKELFGTGDAVRQVEPYLSSYKNDILVLCGDTPLLRPSTLKNLILEHKKKRTAATILTTNFLDPAGYGRILRNGDDSVEGIIEELDASPQERLIKEINAGVYIFQKEPLFTALSEIEPDNIKHEYYLTDVIGILRRKNYYVASYRSDEPDEILGVNRKEDLMRAEKILIRRRNGTM